MSMIPLAPPQETLEFSGNKLNCLPGGPVIKCLIITINRPASS